MKKSLLSSYVTGITDTQEGESYSRILRYFLPEFITAFLLYSLPFWLDASFISQLQSTSTYATLGATNNLIHLIMKVAEAFSVGTVVLGGQFNGLGQPKEVGRTLRDAFWITTILGISIASFLYFGADAIYAWYGVPADIVRQGVPFLQVRALGIFFMFIFFAFVGFLRSIKNAKTPMKIFIFGSVVFVFFDYALIFGAFGFPALGLLGSATASVIQYGSMLAVIAGYVLLNKKNRKYGIRLFSGLTDVSYVKHLITISWPVMLDKAILASAYVWLCKMLAPMGTCCVATFCVVKAMERFAFLPAIAFAQVITFLVSNDVGGHNWQGIKNNIKKVVFLASLMVFSILFIFALYSENIIYVFDKKGEFTQLAKIVFPLLSVLSFFDLLQLILAGALRGAGNVRTVMVVRMSVCICFFMPLSYFFSHLAIDNQALKFVLVYGSFYIGNGLMSIAYINRFRGEQWKTKSVEKDTV